MKIVILDTVYFEECHIKYLQSIGNLVVYNNFARTDDEIISRIADANIVIAASTNMKSYVLHSCKYLKLISLASTGYNRIDIDTASKLGFFVTNVPAYSTVAVVEHAFALLLSLMKKIKEGDNYVRNGGYDWRSIRLAQLEGKVFGIIGFGNIGRRVSQIANCFGCQVIVYTINQPSLEMEKIYNVKFVILNQLLGDSDIISLHVPLTLETNGFISFKEFGLMRKGPILINTSRGKVVDHSALINALINGNISGAGLDALPIEPPAADDQLLKFSNTVLSPHVAFHTLESLKRCADIVVSNIEAFLENKPQNIVNNTFCTENANAL
jgi:lactate dehydrogenase-like 2-hydroxyacid dehydrogenase